MKIVVSGAGLVSALGTGVEDNIRAIRCGRSGISPFPTILATKHRLPVGEIKSTNGELTEALGLPCGTHLSRTALLGMLAAREAVDDAAPASGMRLGLVSATSVGGMDLTEHFFRKFMNDASAGRLRDVKMHDCAASTRAIADYCGIDGYVTTISTACSSSANAVMAGARLLRHHVADAVVVGGTDALSTFTLNGFKSLMILDEHVCRPFDCSRSGLNLGEGAGYIVLQREEDRPAKSYCYLTGYANSNDAFHQTASSEDGEGAFLAMSGALEMANLRPSAVSYIHAHGTGTPNNDISELHAICRLFGSRPPKFGSTKGFTGHTLAAAGGIGAVLSALSVRHGYLYPNINFKNPIREFNMIPETEFAADADVRCVISNSFGFGGNCSSVIFSQLP